MDGFAGKIVRYRLWERRRGGLQAVVVLCMVTAMHEAGKLGSMSAISGECSAHPGCRCFRIQSI